jgi:hypothetical protein
MTGLASPAKRGRRTGYAVKLGRAELALAYELRQEGVTTDLIAIALGCNRSHLATLLNRCECDGLSWIENP